MEKDKKALLTKYLICFCVAVGIVLFVFAIKSFDINITVLCDAFTTAGMLLILFSGLLYVSDEGIFIGFGFAMKRALRVFIPMYRKDEETYAEYRERKTGKKKSDGKICIFFTGLFFFLIGMIFLIVWYQA
ncbi:MAG: DUF3899 domain-containing protein [Clostridiales bacterium]|nr:DUF3899 domain-containing protein [Clostridiales bacterium]